MKRILLLVLLLSASFSAGAEWWSLDWTNPIAREDNTLYDHVTEGANTHIMNAKDGSIYKTMLPDVTHYEENFPPGCYSVALTAEDVDGRVSSYSPLQDFCTQSAPKSMTGFTATRMKNPPATAPR